MMLTSQNMSVRTFHATLEGKAGFDNFNSSKQTGYRVNICSLWRSLGVKMPPSIYQIVRIELNTACLYGELVQVIEDRRTCWVRPLALQLYSTSSQDSASIDLRNGPDIICSATVIKPALDTDWIHLATGLHTLAKVCSFAEAHQHLQNFLKKLISSEDCVHCRD